MNDMPLFFLFCVLLCARNFTTFFSIVIRASKRPFLLATEYRLLCEADQELGRGDSTLQDCARFFLWTAILSLVLCGLSAAAPIETLQKGPLVYERTGPNFILKVRSGPGQPYLCSTPYLHVLSRRLF